jgi:hypothetical protein
MCSARQKVGLSLAVAAVLVTVACCSSARGHVVQNTNFTWNQVSSGLYSSTIIQALNGDYTDMGFRLDATGLRIAYYALDESAGIYLVNQGDELNRASLHSGQLIPIPRESAVPSVQVPYSSEGFYLGVVTGTQFTGDIGGVFGWVHLRRLSEDAAIMLGNAMSYGADGIIVGTTTEIPEVVGLVPCCAALVAVKSTRSWCRMRRARHLRVT